MTNTMRSTPRAALLALALLAGCNMDVTNPGVVDATRFDPAQDAAMLSLSAQSNLYRAVGSLNVFTGFVAQEVWVGAVRVETNEIGRRVATAATLDINTQIWTPVQRAIATNELAVQTLIKGANAASDINLARAYMNAGFALELMAETFCQGVILTGAPLTPAQGSDTAIARFQQAIAIGTAAAAAGVAEGTKVVNASNAGLARAYLQKKDYAGAATAAAKVPNAFVYNAIAVDDASNRALANGVYTYDIGGRYLVVPPVYRAYDDPRVPWKDAGNKAQDTQLQYYQQLKYPGYAAPTRIASTLEAQYILAEARLLQSPSDPSVALTLIADRRAANGQGAFAGTTTDEILAELMDQRAREFWLEGKRLGDMIRHPAAIANIPAPGTDFYKPAMGKYGDMTCLPVPLAEILANPNFPKS